MFRVDPLRNPEPLIRRVYSYVAYRIGDGPDAEDVTSDTFERALRYRKSYDASRGEPVSWLLGIARRCIDDFFNHRLELADEPQEPAAPGDLEEDTARRAPGSGDVRSRRARARVDRAQVRRRPDRAPDRRGARTADECCRGRSPPRSRAASGRPRRQRSERRLCGRKGGVRVRPPPPVFGV